MRKKMFTINGGAEVHAHKNYANNRIVPWLFGLFVIIMSSSAFAQGSIFGTVTNSNVTTPIDGDITFVGFLSNTDEEIRVETSIGAGYQGGNWFDDFQNYLTEAAGNPYVYHFYNSVNGEGFTLSKLIPANSFQQEDILLAPVAWPTSPTGLSGVGISATSAIITWNAVGGLTYHVYRRASLSNGSFFRLDDPAGSLANPGVVDSFFVDGTVDGVSSYDYLLVAQDPSGNLSAHSTVITVNSALFAVPTISVISPANGPASGGSTVTITGTNFDVNGATVRFGISAPVVATVISPFALTVLTPASSIGAADVTVTNIASAAASVPSVGGFTFDANSPPVLAPIGPQAVLEGALLTFITSATDVNGDIPLMTSSLLPSTATYVDNLDGTGTFNWATSFIDAGVYSVTFYATDALSSTLIDSEQVSITVTEAGNQVPVLALMNDTTISEGAILQLVVSATDPDAEIPSLSAIGLPLNATFTDNLDGTGLLSFSPDLTQAGLYAVTFKATDAALAVDSQIVTITVTNSNQIPVLAPIGPQLGNENVQLAFTVSATDGDGVIPTLSVLNLPVGATFIDSLNGTGLFDWTPSFTDSGTYIVIFYASDGVDIDSELVVVTVVDAGNQSPVLAPILPQSTTEGLTLNLILTASDPDGTIPVFSAFGLPVNATLVDSLNGTALFSFSPDFNQSGLYSVTFYATDGLITDSAVVSITVAESGNQPPVFAAQADTTIDEGLILQFTVNAIDPDGGVLPPAFAINTSLNNFTFVDNGNGTATFRYTPDFFDAGVDTVLFFASDFGNPPQTALLPVIITTNEVNQPPLWVPIGPFSVLAFDTLRFTVVATDSTDPNPFGRLFLSTIGTPANGSFVDNGDATGVFTFVPDTLQVGPVVVTFIAVDQGVPQASSSLPVTINVVDNNIPPVLAAIGPQTILEGTTLIVNVSATDPDGGAVPPQLIATGLPDNSNFADNGNGTGVFTFFPNFVQAGLHYVTIKAFDGISVTKEVVLIQVYEAGDQAPVFDSIPAPIVVENSPSQFVVTAFDPDQIGISLTVTSATLPPFVTYVDSGNGVAVFSVNPDFNDSGTYVIEIIADDGTSLDTINVTLTIQDAGNQLPVLAAIGSQNGKELIPLSFGISYSDIDGSAPPLLTATTMPPGAILTDNRDGTGQFDWTPTDIQAGVHAITFLLEDFDFPGVFDSELVLITIADTNRLPFVVTTGSRSIFEGDLLQYTILATDPDGTIPSLGARLDGLDSLATNMTFFDSGNGIGVLTFVPDYSQGGASSEFYFVRFFATDAVDTLLKVDATAPVQIEVKDKNAPPGLVFSPTAGPYNTIEGGSVSFTVAASDFDAVLPPTIDVLNPPPNSTFNGIQSFKTFNFSPDFTQAGTHIVTFIATDDLGLTTTQDVQIIVASAGNQTPTFITILQDTISIPVNMVSQVNVTAFDPDLDVLIMTVDSIYPLITAGFVDSGNGVGVYSVLPDASTLGVLHPLMFIVQDPLGLSDTIITNLLVVPFLRGDMDQNSKYTMNDLAWLIAFLFRNGPAPAVSQTADIDANNEINIADVTYLIKFLYFNGPSPPQ